MADIGDIVVTAHSDDADDDDGMVPASGATASGATASGATTSGATASGGASPPDAFEDPFEGVDPAALAELEAVNATVAWTHMREPMGLSDACYRATFTPQCICTNHVDGYAPAYHRIMS